MQGVLSSLASLFSDVQGEPGTLQLRGKGFLKTKIKPAQKTQEKQHMVYKGSDEPLVTVCFGLKGEASVENILGV